MKCLLTAFTLFYVPALSVSSETNTNTSSPSESNHLTGPLQVSLLMVSNVSFFFSAPFVSPMIHRVFSLLLVPTFFFLHFLILILPDF